MSVSFGALFSVMAGAVLTRHVLQRLAWATKELQSRLPVTE